MTTLSLLKQEADRLERGSSKLRAGARSRTDPPVPPSTIDRSIWTMGNDEKYIEGTRRKAASRKNAPKERAVYLAKARELVAAGRPEDAQFVATVYCVRRGIA